MKTNTNKNKKLERVGRNTLLVDKMKLAIDEFTGAVFSSNLDKNEKIQILLYTKYYTKAEKNEILESL